VGAARIWLRLVAIEARRNEFRWLFPAYAVCFAWFTERQLFDRAVVFWVEASVLVRNADWFLVPITAAVAADVAGREHRRRVAAQLDGTALPTPHRLAAIWAGTALLGAQAYAAIALYTLGRTATLTDWDGPYWGPMLVGLLAVPTAAAVGQAIGRVAPYRLTPTGVMLGGLMLLATLATPDRWYAYLSPVVGADRSPWHGVRPSLEPWQALFLVGLTGLAFGTSVWRRWTGWIGPAGLLVAILLTAAGAGAIAARAPEDGAARAEAARMADGDPFPDPEAPALGTYEPACDDAAITVCVHPAFVPMLGDASARINRMLAPVLGLPGVPRRIELLPGVPRRAWPRPGEVTAPTETDGVLRLPLDHASAERDLMYALQGVASDASYGAEGMPNGPVVPAPGQASSAVLVWLLERAAPSSVTCKGDTLNAQLHLGGYSFGPVPCAEAARFAAVDPASQQAWLRAHWADLRAGRVPLAYLPGA
jgi:hypothetical protein